MVKSIETFSTNVFIKNAESVVFFLIIIVAVFLLNRWLSKKE